jgi:hypothetical protein
LDGSDFYSTDIGDLDTTSHEKKNGKRTFWLRKGGRVPLTGIPPKKLPFFQKIFLKSHNGQYVDYNF